MRFLDESSPKPGTNLFAAVDSEFMASLDLDLVRHALTVASTRGFAEVTLEAEGSSFRAAFLPRKRKSTAPGVKDQPDSTPQPIRSPFVGYYRRGLNPLKVGGSVSRGDVVAVVEALGIANDVEASVGGEVVEVFVEEGESVQFGQILATVKP